MFSKHQNLIDLFIEWYIEVKNLCIIAEGLDPSNKLYIQPYNELRYSLDHFAKAIIYDQNDKGDKTTIALQKAIGHLQRAYADLVEWMLLVTSKFYNDIFNKYEVEDIRSILPNYFEEIRPKFNQLKTELKVYKQNKSSEESLSEDDNKFSNMFLNSQYTNDIIEIYNTLNDALPEIIKLKKRRKKKAIIQTFVIPVITAVVGGLIVWYATSICLS